MVMSEIEIGGVQYRTGVLNVFDQLNVVRRIAPLLSGLGQSLAQAPNRGNGNGEDEEKDEEEKREVEANFWASLKPIALALKEMSDEDTTYIVRMCLSKCRRLDSGAWAMILASSGRDFMFPIDLAVAMQLTYETLSENLESFFQNPLLLASLGGPEPKSNSLQ
jgi:hypothetical protein